MDLTLLNREDSHYPSALRLQFGEHAPTSIAALPA